MNNMNTLTNEAIKSRIEALKNSHAQNKNAVTSTYLADAKAFEELLSLRAQLAELRGQEPVAWIVGSEEIDDFKCGREVMVMRDGDEDELEKMPLYARPVPPAASPTMMECWSCKKSLTLQQRLEADGMCPHCDAEIELDDAPASQPYTVPDELTMSLNGIAKKFECNESQAVFITVGWNACRAAMLQLSGNSEQVKAYPDKLPCDVHLVPGLKIGKGCPVSTLHGALLRREEFAAELESMTPEQRQAHDKAIADFKSEFLPNSPVIPDGWVKGKFAYDTLFNAIGKAVNIQGEALSISVKAFEDAMLAADQQHKGE